MSEPAVMIAMATPNPANPEDTQKYLKDVFPILEALGGTVVRRVRAEKVIVGEQKFAAALIMEFPSAEAIEKVFASPEYQALVPVRDKGFTQFDVVVTRAM